MPPHSGSPPQNPLGFTHPGSDVATQRIQKQLDLGRKLQETYASAEAHIMEQFRTGLRDDDPEVESFAQQHQEYIIAATRWSNDTADVLKGSFTTDAILQQYGGERFHPIPLDTPNGVRLFASFQRNFARRINFLESVVRDRNCSGEPGSVASPIHARPLSD
jgi:hypothetical protein